MCSEIGGEAETLVDRLKLVRLAAGPSPATPMLQGDFARLLDTESVRRFRGAKAPRYQQSTVAKIETGSRRITLDDIAVYAAVDRERRGKLWLAWGESSDASLADLPPGLEGLTKALAGLPIRAAGTYSLDIFLNGTLSRSAAFVVTTANPPSEDPGQRGRLRP